MFTRIVVGFDGSDDSIEAVKVASQLAAVAPAGSVDLVTAYEPLTLTELSRLDRELPSEFRDQLTGDLLARSVVEQGGSLLTSTGTDHTVHELQMKPAEAIVSVARQVDADLIVVGSRGEGAINRLRHGSTSTKVLHTAKRSVLVVQPPPE